MLQPDLPMSQEALSPFAGFPSVENPDWGYARTCRAVLMAPSVDWVQSVYSCQLDFNNKRLIAPNRDFPYEGLTVYQDGENWKLIDCLALGLLHNGRFQPLIADPGEQAVQLNPWQATYTYRMAYDPWLGRVPIQLTYYLNSSNTPEWVSGCVELYCPGWPDAGVGDWHFFLQPFLDIRHMFGRSDFHLYQAWPSGEAGDERFNLQVENHALSFYLPGLNTTRYNGPEFLRWYYKMGTGARAEVEKRECQCSETLFTTEEKSIVSYFDVRIPAQRQAQVVRIFFGAGLGDEPLRHTLEEVQAAFAHSRQQDREQWERIKHTFPLPAAPAREAVWARIAGLTRFKAYIRVRESARPVPAPYAGAWWFKTPWFRDVFEGLLSSFTTLMALPEERDGLRRVITLAMEGQEESTGRVMDRIPEYKHILPTYHNADAALLCFITAFAYLQETQDQVFVGRVFEGVFRLLRHLTRREPDPGHPYCPEAAPRVDPASGLLLCAPHHSWMDTRSQQFSAGGHAFSNLPSRAAQPFLAALFARLEHKERLPDYLHSPNFFLPEINAQWILLLRGILACAGLVQRALAESGRMADQAATTRSASPTIPIWQRAATKALAMAGELLPPAEANFKAVFWNPAAGSLFSLVDAGGEVHDSTPSEPAVAAAAMLGRSIFSPLDLANVLEHANRELLVERRMLKYGQVVAPFGLLARNDGRPVFYNDEQYHSAVVWPRSTPYLIRLLRLLGQDSRARLLALNALDHQMTEAAIFYNQELLALPTGNNPHPVEILAGNPVPVKNPIQFWSQWCDAIIECFSI